MRSSMTKVLRLLAVMTVLGALLVAATPSTVSAGKPSMPTSITVTSTSMSTGTTMVVQFNSPRKPMNLYVDLGIGGAPLDRRANMTSYNVGGWFAAVINPGDTSKTVTIPVEAYGAWNLAVGDVLIPQAYTTLPPTYRVSTVSEPGEPFTLTA